MFWKGLTMKISDLKEKREIPPQIVHADASFTAHIQTGWGTDPEGGRRNYYITKCNRLLRFGWLIQFRPRYEEWKESSEETLCERCGTVEEFDQVFEDYQKRKIEDQKRRDRERKIKDAEYVAEQSWAVLSEQIEEGVINEIENLVERGYVLVPFKPNQISALRGLIKHYIRQGTTDITQAIMGKKFVEHLEGYEVE